MKRTTGPTVKRAESLGHCDLRYWLYNLFTIPPKVLYTFSFYFLPPRHELGARKEKGKGNTIIRLGELFTVLCFKVCYVLCFEIRKSG